MSRPADAFRLNECPQSAQRGSATTIAVRSAFQRILVVVTPTMKSPLCPYEPPWRAGDGYRTTKSPAAVRGGGPAVSAELTSYSAAIICGSTGRSAFAVRTGLFAPKAPLAKWQRIGA